MEEDKMNDLKSQLEELNSQLTGNMMQDMEIKDKIHNLEMVINGTKPTDSHVECIGCGS
jgi:hypothetical protein